MRKQVAVTFMAVGLAIGALAGCKPQTFANCTEMNEVYAGGVGRPGAVDNRPGGGHAQYAPRWDADLYTANQGSDRDRDGIACEQ